MARTGYQTIGVKRLPDTEVLTPTTFEAKFDSRCAGCGGPIVAGTQVQGIRVKRTKPSRFASSGLKWIVWHANSQCYNAIVAKGVLRGNDVGTADPAPPVTSEEERWLAAFREAKDGA